MIGRANFDIATLRIVLTFDPRFISASATVRSLDAFHARRTINVCLTCIGATRVETDEMFGTITAEYASLVLEFAYTKTILAKTRESSAAITIAPALISAASQPAHERCRTFGGELAFRSELEPRASSTCREHERYGEEALKARHSDTFRRLSAVRARRNGITRRPCRKRMPLSSSA